MSKNNKNGHSTISSMQSAKFEDASTVATAVETAPVLVSDRGVQLVNESPSVETAPVENKVVDDVVFHQPQQPKAMSAKERCQMFARKFETTGLQPLMDLDASVYGNVKFRGKVQPTKGWSADALAGKKMGDLTVDVVIEAATQHIADNQQGSREQSKRGTVSLGLNAQRDVILPKEAAEVLAGEFYKQCTAE